MNWHQNVGLPKPFTSRSRVDLSSYRAYVTADSYRDIMVGSLFVAIELRYNTVISVMLAKNTVLLASFVGVF